MACLGWLLNLGFAGGAAPAEPPTVPGAEFTVPENRAHFIIPENRPEFTLPTNRAHFIVPEQD